MDLIHKIEAVWQQLSLVQRALLGAVVMTLVVAGVFLTRWASRPEMQVLYAELDPDSAAKITEKLSEKGIVYTLSNNGTTIYVPKEQVTQLRLDMARAGLPDAGQQGYDIFDNEKIGISPFVQSVNFQRALQEELAKSIQMIDGVVHARIHIVKPDQTLFNAQAGETSASVVLRLKPGYKLSALNVAAITHLVAGSVDGVSSDHVTVVDSQGHLLSGHMDQIMAGDAGTVADYKERVEQSLQNKVESMLTTVLGPGRASVKVSAEIDMTSVNTRTETPIKGEPVKEEITSSSESPDQASGGGVKKEDTTLIDYAEGKTVKQEVVLPGEIQSLTVAAFVDLSADDPNDTEPIMAIADVEEVIRNALGLKATDSIKVVQAKFRRPDPLAMEDQEGGGLDFVAIAGQASMGVMAICALLVLRIFKGTKKQIAVEGQEGTLALSGEGGAAGELLPGRPDTEAGKGNTELMLLRKRIAESLRSNPDQARRLFTSWLEEKGG